MQTTNRHPLFLEPCALRRWRLVLLPALWWGMAAAPAFAADPDPASPAPPPSNPMSDLKTPPPTAPTDPDIVSASSAAPPAIVPSAPQTPSQNVTINLINLMVKRGLITKEDAEGLIKEAEQEADVARAQAADTQAKAERALATQAAPAPAPPPPAQPSDDEVRVPYVPDVVKKQIADQVTQDVLKQTHDEQLTTPDTTPDWVKRFRVTGDIRTRYENDTYPQGNAVGAGFINFNAINTSSNGLTVNPALLPNSLPQYDVDENRDRFRLRARIGAEIDLGDNFTSGLRLATGSDDSPVTENQTLGGTTSGGQGGDFGKYQIWLDRAFIKYELGGTPDMDLSGTIGRFENPFMHTSMIWADDLGFDGAVIQGRYKVFDGVTPFLTAGAFPVFNTDLNFSSDQSAKFHSEDKYLFATQGGTSWKINQDFTLKGAAAYYDYENIQGEVSDPIPVASSSAVGDTDDSRPAFAQNGNTYIAIRNFTDPNPADTQDQYFGLATPFHELALTGQVDFSRFDPFHLALIGEMVDNLAFDRADIVNGGSPSLPGPQNNTTSSDPNSFNGGNMGYMLRLNAGKVALEKLWDWNVYMTYRYVQSDATVDGFTDADFGGVLTGTNLKGYTFGGKLALSPRVSTGLVFMSADSIAGPTYKSDLLQFDLTAKF